MSALYTRKCLNGEYLSIKIKVINYVVGGVKFINKYLPAVKYLRLIGYL